MEERNDIPRASGSADMASNVPNVRSLACSEPATTRIEIYAPRDGRAHGSLDGVMYLCQRHADEFLEVSGTVTTHRTVLDKDDILCGEGWDFVAMRPLEAAPLDVLGDGHPVVSTAVEAICHGDLTLLPFTRRALAARILDEWPHGVELSDRERVAVLAQFPETVKHRERCEPDEIVEALCRIDDKLKAAKEAAYDAGHEAGYAEGYTDGLSRALDPGSIPETPATREAEKKTARGLRATLIVFKLGWKVGRGVRKTDYGRAVDLAVRILEERQAAKGAAE